MSNFSEALADAARGGLCQVLSVPEYINDTLDRIGFFPYTEARRAIPDFWRNLLCDTPAPAPNPPAFTGGQCSARYRILGETFNYPNSQCIGNSSPFDFGAWWGPITGVSVVVDGSFANGRNFSLQFTSFGNLSFPKSIPETTRLFVGSSFNGCPNVRLDAFNPERIDGLPDNCGDPPPDYDPVTPPDVTVPRDVTYENSQGVTVTIPVVFVYARAQLDVDANITIPFTLNIAPNISFAGTVNFNGEVNIGTTPTGEGTPAKDPRKGDCDDIAIPTEPVPTDPTDSNPPPQPDRDREEVIKGVLVTVAELSNERASLIVQSDNPDIYVPSLGHVQFLCRVGDTSAAWTSDQPVKNRRNLIPCPWPDGAIAVRGTPQPGVTWTLTPIRGYAGSPVEYVTQ